MKFHNQGKEVGRTLLAAFLSTILSTGGFLLLAPILAPRLNVISRPIESLPWWAPAAQKLFESTLLSVATLSNPWDAALVGTIGRAPFLELLYSSYSVSLYTVLVLFVVDLAALTIPQHFLASSSPPHTPYDDAKLASYTSALSATFLSLPLYYLSSKFLPILLVTYFDGATKVNPLALPIVIAFNIPTGYALQTLLTRYGIKGVLAALTNVWVTGTGLIYYGIAGAEAYGAQAVDALWLVSIGVSVAATYGFVLWR